MSLLRWFSIALGTAAAIAACGGKSSSEERQKGPESGGNGGSAGTVNPDSGGAGSAGTVGVGGAGGGVGAGGTGGSVHGQCLPSLSCGNGIIETCTWAGCLAQGSCSRTEECDLVLHRGETCESIGFAGGTLSCATCAYDTLACTTCVPGGAVLACESAKVKWSHAETLALDATSEEIAVLWTELTDSSTGVGAYFARYTPDLTQISKTGPIGNSNFTADVALVPLGSGWLLVTPSGGGFVAHRSDASGAFTKTLEIAGTLEDLALGPAGRPLLVWKENSDTLRAAPIADDGTLLSPAQSLFVGVNEQHFEVAHVGDGFLFAGTDHVADSGDHVVMGRISASGAFEGTRRQPVGSPTLSLGLESVEGGATLLYADELPNSPVRWAKFDSTGALVAGPTDVGEFKHYGVSPHVLSTANGSIAAVVTPLPERYPPESNPQSVVVSTLSATGVASTPAVVAKHRVGFRATRIARRGTELIVAWAPVDGDVGLARLSF
jgi:hypothetical protein